MHGINEQIDSRKATSQERTPPPVVVLCTKVEIAEQDSGLRAGDQENNKYQEQKSKHVVHLMRPNAVEDEKKLDKDAAKGQDTPHHYARNRLRKE